MSSQRTRNGTADGREDQPLLGSASSAARFSRTSRLARLRKHLTQDIDTRHGDLILLLCYIITGLLDSTSIKIWSNFVSMQTGNTVYIGLGLVDGGARCIKAAVSVGCFCTGSFLFARYHRLWSPKERWVLISAHLMQALFIAVATIILANDPPEEEQIRWQSLVPIALLSFQAAGQAVTSRALKFNALTSVVLTSIYCDLFSDAHLFAWPTQNVERNQRFAAPLALLVGVVAGGLWAKSEYGSTAALWMALALKLGIALAWFLWKPAKEEDD